MLSNKLFLSLYILSVFALFAFTYSSIYNQLLEVFLLLIVFVNGVRLNIRILPIFAFSSIYIGISFIFAVLVRKANILDFLLVYKFFIYVLFISFLTGKNLVEQNSFTRFYRFLLWVFIIKYALSITVFNNTRPMLFYENNYELMFLSLLFYLNFIITQKARFSDQLILSLIFIMSGSKSGLLILLFVLALVNYKYLISKAHIIIPAILALIAITITIFKQRMGGTLDIEKIDRFKFLMVFFEEIRDWSPLNYLLGAPRITSLSAEGCAKLGYYKSLFSYSGDGSCYSVIFHSYILRVIFDHGIIGLLLMMYIVFRTIRISGYTTKDAYVVLAIGLINGLSVSSFNSIYFVLGLVFFLILKKQNETNKIAT